MVHPSCHLAAVQAEGDGTTEGKSLVFAEEVVRRCVGHFNGAVLHAVHHTESWHQFAAGMHRDDKLTTGHFADFFGKCFSCAVNGVQRFRKAGSQAPADVGSRGLSLHRRGNAGCENTRDTCIFDDETTVHKKLLNCLKRCILRDRQAKVLVLTREKTGVYP